jgi:hypothetical protein
MARPRNMAGPRRARPAANAGQPPPPAPPAAQRPVHVGKARRSHAASTFGPGAVVDVRAPSGAPISGVVAGLEEWDRAAPQGRSGLLHFQRTHEPRLQRRLGVAGFRLPPVKEDDSTSQNDLLPIVRFPGWLVCPGCERLDRADRFTFDRPGDPERWCGPCNLGRAPRDRVHAVPVRFIVACEDGHLNDFAWQRWIGCDCGDRHALRLSTEGAGLAGKVVSCGRSGCASAATSVVDRSLEGAFGKNALRARGIRCSGGRPWLPAAPDDCQRPPRVLQRGASAVYFSASESSLDIPPFSTDLSTALGADGALYMDAADEDRPAVLRTIARRSGQPLEVLQRVLEAWRLALDAEAPDAPLEWAEYLQLVRGGSEPIDGGQFQTRPGTVPPEFLHALDAVVLVRRLREVRALVGFTRIKPPAGPFRDPTSRLGRLYATAPNWLPAVELRGEGVFLRFSTEAIAAWEARPAVIERARQLASRRATPDADPAEEARKTSPRFLMLHSFAHGLMRQLSLECGYSSAALRERLYVGFAPKDMAGVLIHTGSADSEGTLGGLVRQGKEARLERTIREMLRALSWCSSDPLCITGATTLSSPENLAACHACLLAPETSCQHFNVLLDRALLVGAPGKPELGYFRGWLEENL